MNIEKHNSISTVAVVIAVVVILVIAGVAVYFVSSTATSTTSSTLLTASTSTTTSSTSSTTSTSSTSSSSSTTSTTTTSVSLYGPTNSSVLVDESQTAAFDSMDPQYAFYLQDEGMLNAVYQNLVELNGTSGNIFQPVLADSYNVNVNGGLTNTFHIRSGVWFSNGDKFSSYDQWFTIERDLFMNAPSDIAGFNWNFIIYNITTNTGPYTAADEYSDNYCWNVDGLGLTAGVADAIAHVTGLNTNSETMASCNLAVSVMTQMLSNFNPSNATQAAIMAYAGQAVVAPNASSFIANYLHPLGVFGLELWSGFDGQNVVDPAFIDAHGGVINNTVNSYVNINGAVGTGPYEVVSVGAGLSPVVFKAVPNYWGASNPAITGNASMTDAQPAKISTVIYEVAASDTDLKEDFATNRAQLSYEDIAEYGQMFSAFHANEPSFPFSQVHYQEGQWVTGSWFLMNDNSAPTNSSAFRRGWEYAINYTELNIPNYYNGTAYYTYFVGALTPGFGSFYNPANYSPPLQNTTLAYNEFNEAGKAQDWYTVVPSTFTLSNGTSVAAGTIIGNPNGQSLQPLKLYYTVPLLAELRGQLMGIVENLQVFGVTAVPYGVTETEMGILSSSASTFPQVELLGWGPDFEDPFLAMYYPLLTPSPYNGFYTNQTTISAVYSCLFPTGAQIQACAKTLEQYTVQNAIFPPFPNQPYFYFFIQPYVRGFVNNGFVGYWYNQLYYVPQPT